MRNETVEEYLKRDGVITKLTRVLGEKSSTTARHRGGNANTRMGKNGSGRYSRSESWVTLSSSSYGRSWVSTKN